VVEPGHTERIAWRARSLSVRGPAGTATSTVSSKVTRPKLSVGPRRAISASSASLAAYVMKDDYVGLPSSMYLGTMERGYEQWELPVRALEMAVARVKNRLFDQGIRAFEPDDPKRLKAQTRLLPARECRSVEGSSGSLISADQELDPL
jgi:hypothetical protein